MVNIERFYNRIHAEQKQQYHSKLEYINLTFKCAILFLYHTMCSPHTLNYRKCRDSKLSLW